MDDVLAAFEALPAVEQRALAVLLVLHRKASRTDFTRLLRAAGLRRANGKPFEVVEMAPILEGWRRRGLAEQDESGAWQAARHAMHALAEHLAAGNELALHATQVRTAEPLGWRSSVVSRELFLALYLPRLDELDAHVKEAQRAWEESVYVVAYGRHIPLRALRRAQRADALAYVESVLPGAVELLLPVGQDVLDFTREVGSTHARASATQYLALHGDHEAARAMAGPAVDAPSHAAHAFLALTERQLARAREHARAAVDLTRARGSQRVKGLAHPLWPWVTLLLITDQADPSSSARGREQLDATRKKDRHQYALLQALETILHRLQSSVLERAQRYVYEQGETWTELALIRFALVQAPQAASARFEELCAAWAEEARQQGTPWVERALGGLSLVEEEAPWQRALRALERALPQPTSVAPIERAERIAWVLETARGSARVTPRLQTQRGTRYSGGRAVNLKRLFQAKSDDPLLDEHDRRVVDHLRELPHPMFRHQVELGFGDEVVLALVGHPRVFADLECTQPVEIEQGHPSLLVLEREDGGWTVQVEPQACGKLAAVAERIAEDRMRVYVPTLEQRAVFAQLPRDGLVLPAEAREPARQTLGKLAALFPTSSALELTAREVVEREADPRIHVQLRRQRSGGMRASFLVAPLPGTARLVAGEGSAVFLTPADGKTLRCTRDLTREREELAWLCEALTVDGDVLALPALVDCLELLTALQSLGDRVVVEWPEGDPLTIAAQRDVAQLTLRIGDDDGWLSAEGTLAVDDTLTLAFRELVARTQPRHGRFVALDDGRYLALSTALQRSLDAAEALARVTADRVSLHPLAFLALSLDEAEVQMTPALTARIQRARESSGLAPEVPHGFEAELRPYQRDGYHFLHRLAHWQAGACLADDMGLGKTLQTLALLVERAPGGPAIVVAPTSVCANWVDEVRRFAPSLNIKRLAAGDRERTLSGLGAFDLLVCSYGVLQQERDRLRAISFHTAVLDEAQAIKNANTQRTRAAFELQAAQRIALTGTPIENHLGELWSILNFLNPGLLGSEREFEQRFVRPIQRDRDRARAQLLRRLVTPFVLRRKKSEVLDDLPEKTVITLRIEPSPEERALYAALREEALARIARSGQPGQARIQLFAELMRMRRAACDPALVLAEGAPASSKLAALEELLQELRDNGHRALVFSQFVDYLGLVRARLDATGARYQYLDGSSTPAARKASVDAFQRGEGELFLISLKAGGFGLNLTAADYVIHLDPWWNPAVEDQASDRAHRIGQTRPVTIYRLLVQDSIEEKILALHASKRALADDVLEGESRTPFEMDQLLELLAEAHAPRGAQVVAGSVK